MHLHEAVEWVAWRGEPVPRFGSEELGDGQWIDWGDREEGDQLRVNGASDELRSSLAQGTLRAWGRTGYEQQVPIEPAHWARAFGNAITDWSMRFDGFDIVLVPKGRVRELWPPAGRKLGRTPDHDWGAMKKLAEAATGQSPGVSRNALAASLVEDYRDKVSATRVPDISQIRKKLKDWGLSRQI